MKYKLSLECHFETDAEIPTGIKFGDKSVTSFLEQLNTIEFDGKEGTTPVFKLTMEKVEE